MTNEKRQQLLVIVAAAAVVLLAGDSFVATPLLKAWKTRSTHAEELTKQIARGKSLVSRQQSVHDDWDNMRTNSLPSEKSSAESLVVKAVNTWSKESGVSLASIKGTWKKDEDAYDTYDCHVDATGTLPNVTKFLYDIESSPLALKVDSVEIRAREATGQQFDLSVLINGLRLTSTQP